jgi:protocatechuate 3,4-dioxygenase beta subunit
VSGLVLDPEGKPIEAAFVSASCNGGEGSFAANSNEEGRFELAAEAAGCEATARHPGHIRSEPVRLTAGDRNTLRLSAGGSIAGIVVDERGAPVTSYLLAVESFQPSGEGGPRAPVGRSRPVSNPAGEFLLEGLPPGRYVLTASAEGRPPTRSSAVDVGVGSGARGVRIELARGARLTGTVLDAETRRPIADARVALDAVTSTGANAIAGATTDASGAYALEGVPPGPFSVRASAEGYRAKIVSGLTTRGAPSIREDILLQPHGDAGAGVSELVGIGAMLAPGSQGVLIAGLVDGGPAERAGIQRSDRILRIDGADATSMTVSDCVQRLRGPEGSRVSISLAREGSGDVEVTVVRATIVR